MNKTILKILIGTLILLIGIGAVSAIEHNSTDEFLSAEQTDEISIMENNTEVIAVNESNTEVLSAENNNTVISVNENNTEVLSAENNNTVISVCENNNTVISVSNDDDLTSDSSSETQPLGTQTEYKTVYLGKMKFLKKYKKWVLKGYKPPSKKNKKAWKNHITFQKAVKKQMKQFEKTMKKIVKKYQAQNWKFYEDPYYKIKYSSKYMYLRFYANCYRD